MRFSRSSSVVMTLAVMSMLLVTALVAQDATKADPKPSAPPAPGKTLEMFNGKNLAGWKETNFGGEGEVKVEDGAIVMDFGSDMTGITWDKESVLPKANYEVTFEAARLDGGDFFCGLTFPVRKEFCSLILGGWGGGVCGLSSLDGLDASENTTTSYREFKAGQWYKVKLSVGEKRIRVWLDGKEIIDQDISDKKLSVRGEVEQSKPFGFSTWRTRGAVKNIKLSVVAPAAVKADDKPAPKK